MHPCVFHRIDQSCCLCLCFHQMESTGQSYGIPQAATFPAAQKIENFKDASGISLWPDAYATTREQKLKMN